MPKTPRPPLTPADATHLGRATIVGALPPLPEARHILRWVSQSRDKKEHFSSCDDRGGDLRCSCEWAMHHGSCKHTSATIPTLAHFGVTLGPPADPGGAVGEPPELAGLAECEDAARDARKRRHAEAMIDLYGAS